MILNTIIFNYLRVYSMYRIYSVPNWKYNNFKNCGVIITKIQKVYNNNDDY